MTTKCCHDLVIFKENRQVVGNCDNVARGDSPRFWGRTIMGELRPPIIVTCDELRKKNICSCVLLKKVLQF